MIVEKRGAGQRIAATLADIAHDNSIEIVSCAEKLDLSGRGRRAWQMHRRPAHKKAFRALPCPTGKTSTSGRHCQCVESQDIGQYNTCTHGCIYCYATSNKSSHTRTEPCTIQGAHS